ncbi:Solute carrier family 23 member 1 [Holothuria leucospilota]|uniref:Solute carrier family 23 member 1 n=1 Tax=Holothuria leucospilota TaxID=206669 RepID=A0A9Q1CKW2_HOLLE|nr:Solute carrier family 23 member 1 [Holothuria leucospilota]
MLIAAVTSTVLDNVIVGTPEEKGMHWKEEMESGKDSGDKKEKASPEASKIYDLPFGMNLVTQRKWTRFIPFCPTFKKSEKRNANVHQFELVASE